MEVIIFLGLLLLYFKMGRLEKRLKGRKLGEELGYSSLLTILKNREFGARGKVKLEFNEPSRRLFQKDGSPAKRYGWEMRNL